MSSPTPSASRGCAESPPATGKGQEASSHHSATTNMRDRPPKVAEPSQNTPRPLNAEGYAKHRPSHVYRHSDEPSGPGYRDDSAYCHPRPRMFPQPYYPDLEPRRYRTCDCCNCLSNSPDRMEYPLYGFTFSFGASGDESGLFHMLFDNERLASLPGGKELIESAKNLRLADEEKRAYLDREARAMDEMDCMKSDLYRLHDEVTLKVRKALQDLKIAFNAFNEFAHENERDRGEPANEGSRRGRGTGKERSPQAGSSSNVFDKIKAFPRRMRQDSVKQNNDDEDAASGEKPKDATG